jgi:hypothetical protein
MGADLKEDLAYSTGWVGTERREVGRVYNRLID